MAPHQALKAMLMGESTATFRFFCFGVPEDVLKDKPKVLKDDSNVLALSIMPTVLDCRGKAASEGFITFNSECTLHEAYKVFNKCVVLSGYGRALTPAQHRLSGSQKFMIGDRETLRTLKKRRVTDAQLTPEELERKYPGIRAVCYRHITLLKQAQESASGDD